MPDGWELLFTEKRIERDWRVYVYRIRTEAETALKLTGYEDLMVIVNPNAANPMLGIAD